MDGNGALFGTLCGNTRDVLHRFTVDLPKKHGKFVISLFMIPFHQLSINNHRKSVSLLFNTCASCVPVVDLWLSGASLRSEMFNFVCYILCIS